MIGYICVWVTIISGVERVWSVSCYSCTAGSADFTNLCVGASTAVYPGMTRRQSHVRRTEGWNSGYKFRITTSGSMMIGEWANLGRGREIGFCPRDYGIGQSTASFNNKYIIWKMVCKTHIVHIVQYSQYKLHGNIASQATGITAIVFNIPVPRCLLYVRPPVAKCKLTSLLVYKDKVYCRLLDCVGTHN